MGLMDAIVGIKINRSVKKFEKDYEKRKKERDKENLAQAREVMKKIHAGETVNATSEETERYIASLFEAKEYVDSAMLCIALLKRRYTGSSWWTYYGSALFYYGHGGIVPNMETATEITMLRYEAQMDDLWFAQNLIGVVSDPENERNNKENRKQLLNVDRDRFVKLMDERYKIHKKAYIKNPGEKEDYNLWNQIISALAMQDLDRLGYWQVERTADAVVKFFKDWADKGDAAGMYWLAICGYSQLVDLSEEEGNSLLKASAQKKYAPAVEFYSKASEKYMTAEEKQRVEKFIEVMKKEVFKVALA